MRTYYGATARSTYLPHRVLLAVIAAVWIAAADKGSAEGPVERQLTEGDRLSIPCRLETPGGSVQWVLNGHLVTLEDTERHATTTATGGAKSRRFWDVMGDGSAALTIMGVSRKDQGHWDCWELAEDGVTVRKMTNVLKLTVVAAPEDPYLEVEGHRLAHQATLTLREYHVLPVSCVVEDAFPAPERVDWTLGGEPLTPDSAAPTSPVGQSRSQVAVNASREHHRAEIICRVQHPAWPRPAVVSAALNVLYPPSFSISRDPGFGYPLMSGSRVWLHCSVDANPASGEPVWLRDDEGGESRVLPSGDGFLNFSALSQADVGWYRCATQHPDFGTFASFGYYLNVRAFVSDPPQSEQSDDIVSPGRLQPPPPAPEDAPRTDLCGVSGSSLPHAEPLNKSLAVTGGSRTTLAVRFCHSSPLTLAAWLVGDAAIRPGEARGPYTAHDPTSESPGCQRAILELPAPAAGLEPATIWFVVVDSQGGTDSARIRLNGTGRRLASLVGASGAALVSSGHVLSVILVLLTAAAVQRHR